MTARLLQHRAADGTRRCILAQGDAAQFLRGVDTTLALAEMAIATGRGLLETAQGLLTGEEVDIAAELQAGRLLAAVDHADSARCLLSGTGLTHLGSAEGRDKMHRKLAEAEQLTDSMRMFLEGLEGGKPGPDEVGQQPEWFYKGDGLALRGPGERLCVPSFSRDGSEEPEIAGIYLIGQDGTPLRLGFALANEFSDHVTERHNYLWLAHSKLRPAALGAELLLGELPRHVVGTSRILRDGAVAWEREFLTGEDNMSHHVANLETHHFKYTGFRRPGDVHVHFFGTATLSFSDEFQTRGGDEFEISAAPFVLPLRNRLEFAPAEAVPVLAL